MKRANSVPNSWTDGSIASSIPSSTASRLSASIGVAAGRDPAEIRRVYNVSGVITEEGAASDGFLHGPVQQWVEELTALVVDQG
jgi:hypothetical protein